MTAWIHATPVSTNARQWNQNNVVVVMSPDIKWWDGAIEQSATLAGWWDGTTLQPVTLAGWVS